MNSLQLFYKLLQWGSLPGAQRGQPVIERIRSALLDYGLSPHLPTAATPELAIPTLTSTKF